ncbi:hypothetical protein C1903_08905 [Listeria ivanovii]|uniref:hypothetical protein n=1 Tax=Listeria ivanovii TaxID=1638 RepID=UPI000DAA5C20|nr:hypothetical protein [Listeria ivanovii]PZF88717.1 hypothetical protein C1905_08860 [Listeria ivanovii]PZF93931.1 hypothetical protein C1903_08905 [Listeria ivanovii]PZG04694.1 hypothetical protein C2L88_08340 [Listeria ivanovii]PZG09098.1 hypothetical protein C1901_08695 [Listeria ivanovii]PZG26043.1 hypothetical protein C1900_08870 [Listeria ivanovii]
MYKKKSEWLKTSKVIEKVAIAGLACLVIFSIPIPTQATEQMATYIPFNGKQYEYSSKKISKQPTWQHTAYNKSSSTTQKVKYKVSREKYVKGSVSTSAEFSLMKTGVKVSTSGYIVQYSRGNVQSKKAVNGNWTYSSYSSMTEF